MEYLQSQIFAFFCIFRRLSNYFRYFIPFVKWHSRGQRFDPAFKTGARYVEAKKKPDQPNRLIEVTSAGTDGSDLAFREGDSYRILYSDEDMVLIEKVGDTNNPYMVSPDFLRTVSNHE